MDEGLKKIRFLTVPLYCTRKCSCGETLMYMLFVISKLFLKHPAKRALLIDIASVDQPLTCVFLVQMQTDGKALLIY